MAVGGPIFSPTTTGISAYGGFSRRSTIPDEPTIKFGFICPELWGPDTVTQVVFKWGATYTGGPLTVDQYYDSYCAKAAATNSNSTASASGDSDSPIASSSEEEEVVLESERDREIGKIVEGFKAMPSWLAKRTQQVFLGTTQKHSHNK